MHLLLCTDHTQINYLKRFGNLAVFHGHRVSQIITSPQTISELHFKCKANKIDGLLVANTTLLRKLLESQPDFRSPISGKELTLDDYQGSFLMMKDIPCVVLNPPEHIMTVSYGAFIFSRFIEKLTKPDDWFPQTKFVWKLADESNIEEIYEKFKSARLIAIDIETPNPDNELHSINCISFTGYFAESHSTYSVVLPFSSLFWLTWIRKFCTLKVFKVLQGGTYDAVRLLRFNIPILYWLWDTLNLFHSYYSECPKRLDFVAAYSLRVVRYWKDDGRTGNLEDYYRYCAQDGWATLNSLLSLILELPDWARANYLEEFPLVFPCIHCELEGWKVDPERFMLVRAEQEKLAASKLANVRKMLAAPNYNPNSSKQNQNLFKILGCGDIGKTEEGVFKIKTGEAYMKKAEYRHPLNARVLGEVREYKKATKLLTNYYDPSKLWKLSTTHWRLFYRLNPSATDTGRLGSTESSFWLGFQIQNIKRGPTVKQSLVADTGWLLGEPDAEQSEARCVFYLAGEQKGIDLVESGKDYHCYNAELFFGFKYEDLWDEKTKKCKTPEAKYIRDEPAKRTNHGANYNMTGSVMLDTMGPKAVAQVKSVLVGKKLISPTLSLKDTCTYCLGQYAKIYVNVKGLWYESIIKHIELTKKLVSPLGWTRHFFGNPKENKHHLNAAVAHGPQNLSVGVINRAFYKIWWESIYGGLRNVLRIKAQIHDSIPYQYKRGHEWVNERVRELMRLPVEITGADGKVRTMVIPVSVSAGKERWSELK